MPKCNGINGQLFSLLEPFLTDREQRTVFDGQVYNGRM